MDSIFGIGLPELIIILLLAGLIMGPQRIRKIAFTLGRVTAQLQAVSRQFARQLNAELDGLEDESLRGAMQDMRQLQKEVESLRRELSEVPKSLRGEGQSTIQAAEEALQPTSAKNGTEKDVEPGQPEPAQDDEEQPQIPATDGSIDEPPSPEVSESKKPSLPTAIDVPGDPE